MKNRNWKEIAEYQKKNFFTQDEESMKEDMKKLVDLYGQNLVEGLIDGFHCGNCKKEASKRCTKCKSVWYCSRDCQVQNK
jgi:zinc finger MYND domain-containing protein 10